MAVVVRNDSSGPMRFPGKSNQKTIAPGQTVVLSDSEWENVTFDNRGIGKLRSLYPNESIGENLRMKLDYYDPGDGSTAIRYKGLATQTAADADPVWQIQKFSHIQIGAIYKVADIQVLERQRWDQRTTLAWT